MAHQEGKMRLLLVLLLALDAAVAQPDKQRDCGERSCYDVLGVSSGSRWFPSLRAHHLCRRSVEL